MKSLSLALALIAICVMASAVQAGIAGSKHDFGQFGWASNQICLPCHTPHNSVLKDANGNDVQAPLWNHTLSTATYTLYTADNAVNGKTTGEVDQNSKLCLSCHDGTVAVDSFGGGNGSSQMTGGVLGNDLSNDHPIGDSAIWPNPEVSYMVSQTLRDAAGIMPLRKMATGKLAVGCTSCHEPHNRKSLPHMLWAPISGTYTTVAGTSVSGSGLCLNCHKK